MSQQDRTIQTTSRQEWSMLTGLQPVIASDYRGTTATHGHQVFPVPSNWVGSAAGDDGIHGSGYIIWRNNKEPLQINSLIDLVPRQIGDMIEHNPGDKAIRGHIRNILKIVMPVELIGNSEGIKQWMKDNVGLVNLQQQGQAAVQPENQPVAIPLATPPGRSFIYVSYNRETIESGRCRYTCRNTYSGSVRVPLSVFEDGEEAVEDYVKENWSTDITNSDDYDHNDHESDEEEDHDVDIEISDAFDEFNDLNNEE